MTLLFPFEILRVMKKNKLELKNKFSPKKILIFIEIVVVFRLFQILTS